MFPIGNTDTLRTKSVHAPGGPIFTRCTILHRRRKRLAEKSKVLPRIGL
jgi:hypothetical protein